MTSWLSEKKKSFSRFVKVRLHPSQKNTGVYKAIETRLKMEVSVQKGFTSDWNLDPVKAL